MEKNIQTDCKEVMENMGFNPVQPDFSGDGIAVWKAKDKNNKTYLKVKVLKGTSINCFQVDKEKEE